MHLIALLLAILVPPPVVELMWPTPPIAIAKVNTPRKVVALTFDACATMQQTNELDWSVLDIIVKERLPVTLYFTGRWIESHLVEARQLAVEKFIEFGNHSYSHPILIHLDPQQLEKEITLTNTIIKSLGRQPMSLRPPAGAWNQKVVLAARRADLPVILWDVVSADAGGHVPASQMVRSVLRETQPGSIVIFHINGRGPYTKEALPKIITGLREQGYQFLTVSQLLALPGATLVRAKESTYVPRRPSSQIPKKPQGIPIAIKSP